MFTCFVLLLLAAVKASEKSFVYNYGGNHTTIYGSITIPVLGGDGLSVISETRDCEYTICLNHFLRHLDTSNATDCTLLTRLSQLASNFTYRLPPGDYGMSIWNPSQCEVKGSFVATQCDSGKYGDHCDQSPQSHAPSTVLTINQKQNYTFSTSVSVKYPYKLEVAINFTSESDTASLSNLTLLLREGDVPRASGAFDQSTSSTNNFLLMSIDYPRAAPGQEESPLQFLALFNEGGTQIKIQSVNVTTASCPESKTLVQTIGPDCKQRAFRIPKAGLQAIADPGWWYGIIEVSDGNHQGLTSTSSPPHTTTTSS